MKSDFNVLAVMEFLNHPRRGDEIPFLKTALAMKADVYTTPKILEMLLRPNYHDLPPWIQRRIIEAYVNLKLKHCKAGYDFVMTQQKSAFPAIRFAQRIDAKSILFLRSFSKLLSEAMVLADVVIANSEFTKKNYAPFRKKNDIEVLYHPIDFIKFKSISKKN